MLRRILLLALAVMNAMPAAQAAEPSLGTILDSTKIARGWTPPTERDMEADQAFFRSRLEGRAATASRWTETAIEGGRIILHEPFHSLAGQGVFVVATGVKDGLLLQAPHRFQDLHTGTILETIVSESPPAAAAFNSVPRRYDEGGAVVSADMAHQDTSAMLAFTMAFLHAVPDGKVIQLHGFATEKRKSSVAASADLIISDGTRDPGPFAKAVSVCLGKTFPQQRTLLYGQDVFELGGTTNTIGKAIRAQFGGNRFLHIEASLPFRLELKDKSKIRKGLMQCLRDSR